MHGRFREDSMNGTMKRISMGIGATVVAVAMAGGAYAAGQNISGGGHPGYRDAAQGPGGPGGGGFGGPGGRGRGGPGGPGGVLGPMMLGRLDLTDAQKERVKGIVESHQAEMKTLGTKAMKAQRALEDAVVGDTFDEATVRMRAAEVGSVEADFTVARARVYSEVFQALTADQQKKLKDMRTEMRKSMDERQANRQNRGR
jgi:Spy/CpxP family protein refolding chaperone